MPNMKHQRGEIGSRTSSSSDSSKIVVFNATIQFVIHPSAVGEDSEISPLISNKVQEEVSEEEKSEEEEEDMITALANARSKAIERATRQLAVEDGSYVENIKVKKMKKVAVDRSNKVEDLGDVKSSYWRPMSSASSGSNVNRNSGTVSNIMRSKLELSVLKDDLLAEAVINDG